MVIGSLAVTHEHTRISAIAVQGVHQTVGSDGRSPRPLGCINNEYPHILVTKVLKVTSMQVTSL